MRKIPVNDASASEPATVDLLRATELLVGSGDQALSKSLGPLFPALLSLYTRSAAAVQRRCLSLLSTMLDALAWADGVEPALVSEALQCWGEWQPLLIRNLEAPETMEDLKYALKTVCGFYRSYQVFSREFLPQVVKPVWILMYSLLPHFYSQVIFASGAEAAETQSSSDSSSESHPGLHGVAVLLLDLLSSLALRPSVRQAISQELSPILRTLANYALLSRDQLSRRDNDPEQFLLDEESEAGATSARACALKLVAELLDSLREDAVRAVAEVAALLCSPHSQWALTGQPEISDFVGRINGKIEDAIRGKETQYQWRARETAMTLLGRNANDVLAFNAQAAKRDESPISLVAVFDSVLSHLRSPSSNRGRSLLCGRTLWCAARLSEWITVESAIYPAVLDLCVASTAEGVKVPVRFTACFAVSKFAKRVMQAFIDRLPVIMRNLFKLAEVTENDTLHLVLETIRDLSSISEETTDQIAKESASNLLHLFTKYYSDSAISPDIISILRLWADIPVASASLSQSFLPYIGSLLRQENIGGDSPLPTALDLLQIILLKLKTGSRESVLALELLMPLLAVLNRCTDVAVLLHGTNCLRCFIANFHQEILQTGVEDRILETMGHLLSPALNESAAPHLGYCLVQVFDKISPKVDEDLVLGCVTKLYKSKMPSIVQGLVLVCARLIHLNPNALLSFLLNMTVERRVGLKVLLDKWLIHQPLMRGKYTKNATVSALARLFSLKDKRLEALLVIGFNPSHTNLSSEVPAPLKILSTLIRCLDNEAAPRKQKPSASLGLNEEFNTVVEAGGLGVGGHIDFEDSERVDTIEDEERQEEPEEQGDDAIAGLKKQLLSEVQEDFESNFQIQEKKKGLGDYETGSECLMSDMLDFDYDDGDDVGEDFYEDDLYSMGDWYGALNLQNFLLEFFGRLIENDLDYLKSCFRHMLSEDVALFKKHFTLV